MGVRCLLFFIRPTIYHFFIHPWGGGGVFIGIKNEIKNEKNVFYPAPKGTVFYWPKIKNSKIRIFQLCSLGIYGIWLNWTF